MPPRPKALLEDIRDACDAIEAYVSGLTVGEYARDRLVRDAVERRFMIMGEAANQLLQADPDKAASLSDCRKLIDFRNVLVHGYSHVDDTTVWEIIQTRLSKLREEVVELLNQ